MGTFVTAQKTKEIRRQNGKDEEVDVLIFGNKPYIFSTIEEAAESCEKIVRKNILSTWCVFELVAETKTEDYPIKTYLVERDKQDFAGSAEP